jgi:hypothetical protein
MAVQDTTASRGSALPRGPRYPTIRISYRLILPSRIVSSMRRSRS